MDILRLAALAVTGALCAVTLRREVPPLGTVLVLVTGALLLWETAGALAAVRGMADAFSRTAALSPGVWAPVWKAAGVGVVTRLTAALCRDAGEGGVAAFLETAGAVLALVCALPLAQAVLDTMASLL